MGWRGLGKVRKVLIACALCLAALVLATACYLLSYSHPEEHAIGCVNGEVGKPAVQLEGGIAFLPSKEKDLHVGLVLYPGGKVDYRSYAPLAQACAERGISCVIAKMPANIAFLNPDAASGLMLQLPDVQRWYVGGHSLGGVVASSYARGHSDTVSGLVLLASYSTEDLVGTSLEVLSVRGSLDGILDQTAYWENRPNIDSEHLTEVVVDGGNHSQFGCYGLQKGDNPAAISEEEQIRQTSIAIVEFAEDFGGLLSAA